MYVHCSCLLTVLIVLGPDYSNRVYICTPPGYKVLLHPDLFVLAEVGVVFKTDICSGVAAKEAAPLLGGTRRGEYRG